jgi:hypothetical protein
MKSDFGICALHQEESARCGFCKPSSEVQLILKHIKIGMTDKKLFAIVNYKILVELPGSLLRILLSSVCVSLSLSLKKVQLPLWLRLSSHGWTFSLETLHFSNLLYKLCIHNNYLRLDCIKK